ncbi:flagellar protein FliT [Paraburkholderia sp. FT54]|jgi:hypothetical protein|uniref:flagellar protein FliT n=1 Tax=Paraburkholderia sp. FT54 TaxID=3074437 RepID=UPI002877C21C|nr:flagellar protein FliT [Paraburkholderia sp. FT54]WNC89855.1 flagellar protein FliT [Paraburkholderia sp. FT54]
MTSREQAEGLLNLTQAIGHAAQQSDWPEAARLTEQRAPLLMSLTGDVDGETLKIMRSIQAIDAAVMAMAANNKEKLDADYNRAMRSASAMKEYHRVAML